MTLAVRIAIAIAVAGLGVLLVLLQRRRDQTIGFVARAGVPIMMTIAYVVLALTSDTDRTGVAWLSIGLAFVLVIWWVVRYLMTRGALARALAVGDVPRILELADAQIRQRRGDARAPYQLARARAYAIEGDWDQELATLEDVAPVLPRLPGHLRWEVAALRASALVELGRADDAAVALGDPPAGPAPAAMDAARAWLDWRLAQARLLHARGDAGAAAAFRAVVDNIRATPFQRAIAHHFLATLEPAKADVHAREVSRHAPASSWLARA